MSLAIRPRWSSQIATTTAAATMNMKAVFQNASDNAIAASSTIAEAMLAGRSQHTRPWSFCAGAPVGVPAWDTSHLEDLGFLVLQEVVDLVRVALRHPVEALLGPGDVVLADIAVLLELLEALLGVPAKVADRHPAVLGLGTGDLDVLLAALLGELGEHAAQHLAVVGRVDAEVRVADGALDVADRAHVVRRDQDDAGLLRGERRELLDRGGRTVVVDHDLAEHGRVGAPRPDRREVLAGRLDRLVHLAVGLVEDVVDHGGSLVSAWTWAFYWDLGRQPALTSVPILSPRAARRMLPSGSRPMTTIGSLFSAASVNAVWSTTLRSRLIASS